MNSPAIELVDHDRLRVSDREFKVKVRSTPDRDGTIYDLWVTSRDDDAVLPKLYPAQLTGVLGRDLPAGLSIAFASPRSRLRNVSMAWISNINDGPMVKTYFHFDYETWHLPMSLPDFVEVLRAILIHDHKGIAEATIEESEGSILIFCKAPIPPLAGCFDVYDGLDAAFMKAHRAALKRYLRERPAVVLDENAPVDQRDPRDVRWFIQHVAVPVVVGLIGLAAFLLK